MTLGRPWARIMWIFMQKSYNYSINLSKISPLVIDARQYTASFRYHSHMAKQLTASQKKFAEEFVMNDGSEAEEECALSAGYSKSSARVGASELTNPQKYPEVCKYIEELQTQVNQKYNVTFGRHVKKLAEIRDAALEKGNYTAAVAAETQRGH